MCSPRPVSRPDQVALRLGDDERTYAELDDRGRARRRMCCTALGVRRGDRVAVMVPNGTSSSWRMHGAGRLGAIVVPVNIHFKADEAGWVVTDSGATAVVVTRDLLPALDQVPDVPRLVVEDGSAARAARGRRRPGRVHRRRLAHDDGVHVGDHRPAQGRRDGARTTCGGGRRAWPPAATVGLGPDDVHLMVGPRTTRARRTGRRCTSRSGATVVVMRRGTRETALRAHRAVAASRPRTWCRRTSSASSPARRRAGPLRPLVAAAGRARGRAVPGAAQARVHGLRRRRQGVGVLRRVGGRRHRDLAAGVARSSPGSVGKPFPGTEFLDPRRRRQASCPPGEVGTLWVDAGRVRASSTTTTPRRPRRSTGASSSRVGDAGVPRRRRLPVPRRPQVATW